MENTEINIIDLVGDLNNKDITKKQILEKYSITEYAYKKLLKANGYTYNNKLGQWLLESENTGVEGTTKATYRLPSELIKAIKLQAIFEGTTSTEILIKALEEYIPKATKDIIKQNKR